MKIIGLLSWYDEPALMLRECVAALADAGVTHLVAVDGAYAFYPGGKGASEPAQHGVLHLACREFDVALTAHTPTGVWAGNETEKRTFLFRLGWTVADPGDWFWVQDADMFVTRFPGDLKDRLAETRLDVAEVRIHDMVAARLQQPNFPEFFEMASLFRAQPIRVVTHHANYVTDDGTQLWAGVDQPVTETLDLTGAVTVEHRPNDRPTDRLAAKMGAYNARDRSGVERGTCRCGQPSVKLTAVGWKPSKIGPVAEWRETCPDCAARLERVSRTQLLQLGINPDAVAVENRQGHLPRGMAAH